MEGTIKDTQKKAFQQLITKTIPELITKASCDLDENYHLEFQPMYASNSIVLQDNSDTQYYSIKAVCVLKDKISDESVEFNVELLRVPVLQELGFKINGNYMQQLDIYERARGWNFYIDNSRGDCALLLSENRRSIYYQNNKANTGPFVSFMIHGASKHRIKISTFFRAISGYSNEELISMFGYNNPFVIQAFGAYKDERSIYACIKDVAKAVLNNNEEDNCTTLTLKKDIEQNLFNTRYFSLGAGNALRLNYLQSFSYRASGKSLAETIDCNGYHFDSGIILSTTELQILDKLPIKQLKVEHNGKLYNLRKFSTFTFDVLGCKSKEDIPELGIKCNQRLTEQDVIALNESKITKIVVDNDKVVVRRKVSNALTIEDLFTAFSIWTDNLNGYGLHSKQFEVTNRVLLSFDKNIEMLIENALNIVTNNIKHNLNGVDYNGRLALCINDCYKGIDPLAFIDNVAVATNNAGQSSDMCNLMAYVSKSNKAAAQMGANSVTPDMVNVQDLQEGRLDPLDSPESDKIGLVHYKTLLTKLDKDGSLMTPFLRVVNGEVVSEEPVYLTAMEEAGQYIAEWNETFKNPDGSYKKRVRTRCSGNVQSVELNKVAYKEFSPYQNISPAHSMIPFPGHSNGKRITMGCNQVKQAVPYVKRERPSSIAGGESLLGVGCYTGADILNDFYTKNKHLIKETEQDVLSSGLKLVEISNSKYGQRTFRFEVLNVTSGNNEITLDVPYLFRNYESAMFSYDLNPVKDNIYHSSDVVAYNNGYSIEKKTLVKCADFGAQKVDDSVFDRGMALTKNLNVVYKTFGGSVIEDGITINAKLVYDDSLTHIGLFEIKDVITQSKDNKEHFSTQKVDAPEYLCSNGLPRLGTYLKPGMEAISKVRIGENKNTSKYVYTPTYVEGQVIYAGIETTQKGVEAKIILAQRSYAQSGDKMAGRCGNKGVIAKIVPENEMPFIEETGEVADIILNPLGIPSRQNITQLLECTLGYCMKAEDSIALVTPYNPNDVDFVRELAYKKNVVPVTMVDGRTGIAFDRPLNYGSLPMYKLHHVAKKKIHSVGMDSKLDSTFLQPMKGSKQNGGQSFGEMETWCLESVGATTLLNELFTIQSDDVIARNQAIEDMNNNRAISIKGSNCNDLAMQAFYRSLGAEFSVDASNSSYTFEPITDETIRSLYPMPITTRSMLHAASIFGTHRSVEEKALGRSKWGWIDLHTKIILPLWIYKGGISKIIRLSSEKMKSVIAGEGYVRLRSDHASVQYVTKEEMELIPDKEGFSSGMQGLVMVFENYDTMHAEILAKAKLEELRETSNNSPTKREKLAVYRALKDFNQSGHKLADYVVTSFPVMPQTYRPEVKIAGRNTIPDFDWYYDQIIHAANAVEKDDNLDTEKALFMTILEFTGLDEHHQNSSYKSLLKFFCAKSQKKHHGKIRENMQSKRILCSGRAAIKPAEDTTRTPLEMGVPFTILVKIFGEQLYGYFVAESVNKKLNRRKFDKLMLYLALRDKHRFEELFRNSFESAFEWGSTDNVYDRMTEITKAFIEGREGNVRRAVVCGRQPSLHKYSVRAFKPYVVYDYMIHLHPLLCNGYNADFDGDQMYVFAVLSEEATDEALEKLSPAKDFILPKNGSIVLEHSQDIVLGVYCATMLRNNVEVFQNDANSVRVYNTVAAIWSDYCNDSISLWDLVLLKHENGNQYISTAGRVVFNSLIPGAFTDKEYTNTLQLKGIKTELYKELKFDGIICSKKSTGEDAELRYYSLPDICKEVYEQYPLQCIDVYQAITELGFAVSDRTGVSLSLYDFDIKSNKEQILADAEQQKTLVEQDYQDGLISEKDKRSALIAIYGDSKRGANTKIMQDLLDNLPRNNNIFIMMDSGARGNKSQLMHMCGAIGILQKSKTEDLETSVTKNYYSGLNSFDVHLASYSARTGVASTQNETKNAGYATHKVVYMASGIQIVEEDCGCTDFNFDIEWDDHNEKKDRFMPSQEWFNQHLLGRKVDTRFKEDAALTDNGVFTADSYYKLAMVKGFNTLHLQDGVVSVSIFDAKGERVLDDNSKRLLRCMPKNDILDMQATNALLRQKVATVETTMGTFHLRYDISSCCKSLMTKRLAFGLPGLKRIHNRATNEDIDIVTDDTIKFIEENKLDSIQLRTTLKCRSKYGICAHCYGLQFSDEQLPEVGSYVGTESAQSIAEPASQLTMNVINKGGAAGSSSVSSGVQVFDDLLSGSKPEKRMNAVVAANSGYLKIEKMDNMATISIRPLDQNCDTCKKCLNDRNTVMCPMLSGTSQCGECTLNEKLLYNSIVQHNGEWVRAGDCLTKDMVYPDAIVSIGDDKSPEALHVFRQRVWIANYYNTFKDSGISIFARHFELIANVQNKYVQVEDAGTSDLELGKIYEFNEVRNNLDGIKVRQFVSKRNEVTLRNSGAFAALSFENVAEVVAGLVVSGHKESIARNHSLISSLAIGEDLQERTIKKLNKPQYKNLKVVKKQQSTLPVKEYVEAVEEISPSISLANIDLAALTAELAVDVVADTPKVEKVTSFENTNRDEIVETLVAENIPVSSNKLSYADFADFADDSDEFAEESSFDTEKPRQSVKDEVTYNKVETQQANSF